MSKTVLYVTKPYSVLPLCSLLRCGRSLCVLLVLMVLTALGRSSNAADRVVFLNISGAGGDAARSALVEKLQKRYEIAATADFIGACQQLGIDSSSKAGLAQCAASLGARVLIGGRIRNQELLVVVYESGTGRIASKASTAWRNPPTTGQLRSALRTIVLGIKESAESPATGEDSTSEPVAPQPAPSYSASTPESGSATSQVLNDMSGSQTTDTGSFNYDPRTLDNVTVSDPDAPPAAGSNGGSVEENDIPPELRSDTDSPYEESDGASDKKDEEKSEKRPDVWEPRIHIEVGAGWWNRRFEMNQDTAAANVLTPSDKTSAIGIDSRLLIQPMQFVTKGWARGLYIEGRFRMVPALKSAITSAQTGTAQQQTEASVITLNAIRREIKAELGYNWTIMDSEKSPILRLGLGYGMFDHQIGWPAGQTQGVPDFAYRFVYPRLGITYPFLKWFALYSEFAYHLVLSTGQIEDDAVWYGSASKGGIQGAIGFAVNFSGFTIRVGYDHTYYFYDFADSSQARVDAGKRTAGGATDHLQGLMGLFGYSF